MFCKDGELDRLADRVRGGDATAAAGLQQRLAARLGALVEHQLWVGPDASPLGQRVRSELLRLGLAQPPAGGRDRQGLIDQITRRLCATVVGNLQARSAPTRVRHDTVAVC